MGSVVLATFISADGVMQSSGHPDEDPSDGFRHGGWLVPAFADPDFGQLLIEGVGSMSALLLGRRTYEIFATTWPNRPADDPIAQRMNALPKYLASTTLTSPTWQNTTVLSGDVATQVARLKDTVDGEIVIQGSGQLAQSLIAADVIDEYRLLLAPVIVGSGRRLFGSTDNPLALHLARTQLTSTGLVMLYYRRAVQADPGDV